MISVQSATHSLQIAVDGVGPHTMVSTSARALLQNEQRGSSRSTRAAVTPGFRLRLDPSAIHEMVAVRELPAGSLTVPIATSAGRDATVDTSRSSALLGGSWELSAYVLELLKGFRFVMDEMPDDRIPRPSSLAPRAARSCGAAPPTGERRTPPGECRLPSRTRPQLARAPRTRPIPSARRPERCPSATTDRARTLSELPLRKEAGRARQ